ncbi:MAG: hypothetical protein M3R43_07975 [Acidobacteriota bacterium]|nr:hypothetical protein [Acidobacteriota bacterium]
MNLATRVTTLLAASLLVTQIFSGRVSVAAADAEQCPAYSHAVRDSADTLYCKCNEPLINYKGKCQYQAAIEDRLQQRILAALKGIKGTTDAIKAERSALLYTAVGKHLQEIGNVAGVLYLSRKPIVGLVLAKEAMSLAFDLGSTLGEWGSCNATGDLRADCDNLHNFQRILDESATELMKIRGTKK